MSEKFNQKVAKADFKINKDYQESAVRNYTPIFESLMKKADSHMQEYNLDKLELSGHSSLFYSKGNFYDWENVYGASKVEGLIGLVEICQAEAEKNNRRIPSVIEALRNIAEDFRNKIINSIADTID